MISIFELFTVGIGPSSSHTVGPMKATKDFVTGLDLGNVRSITVTLYGSLALTGKGHGSDKAVMLGLKGEDPETVDPELANQLHKDLLDDTKVTIDFTPKLPKGAHANTLDCIAYDKLNKELKRERYFSIGGGFILKQSQPATKASTFDFPNNFKTGDELLSFCIDKDCSISEIVLENEKALKNDTEIDSQLEFLWTTMKDCIKRGTSKEGELPGGLKVQRRAQDLHNDLQSGKIANKATEAMEWLSMYAIAVNEENAAGGRVVTAPTNGAAGIIPSVLHYFEKFERPIGKQELRTFFLTAGAIGYLFKTNASISGAEMGCQGEVGVASSMAAAGLTALLGGNPQQVECAAEIAMEHHLGLTCDPIKGLVQIPCIERNAMGAIKAVNAAQLALKRTLENRKITLDRVIRTMKKTGEDMKSTYKETSKGGLAVFGVEC
ncbi:L-serine ammonia-lyase [Candidatus Marinamargulisbacteria bacterium SCGC AAA071-K20]|nr:L-serine ammonia-lyase [Candidatus Marinamargulisbacteria bacterium SCGC AAA071-K20]